MNFLLLKVLHLTGVIALFTSLGAILLAGSSKKSATMLHGLALILILGAGFAMLGKPPMGHAWWMLKLALWLFLGIAPALAKRKVLPAPLVLLLALAAGAGAAWLGLTKPF